MLYRMNIFAETDTNAVYSQKVCFRFFVAILCRFVYTVEVIVSITNLLNKLNGV